MRGKMGISAKELAEKLNISAATVSMVLNQKPGISEATRQLVLDAAEKYGLERKPIVETAPAVIRFVIYKKHGRVVADTPFFSEVTEGITRGCHQQNCMLQISYFYEESHVEEQITNLLDNGTSGIVFLGTEMDQESFALLEKLPVPVVILDCYDNEVDLDSVLINNEQGAFLAVKHLYEMGHREIGYIRSATRINNFEERADGYYKALRKCGLEKQEENSFWIAPMSDRGYQDMKRQLGEGRKPIGAYFADNDIIAAAAMRALKEMGYHIPEDVSIVGFDDMPMASFLDPPLTTMNVRKKELGITAVNRLLEKIRDRDNEVIRISLSTQLIERESVSKK